MAGGGSKLAPAAAAAAAAGALCAVDAAGAFAVSTAGQGAPAPKVSGTPGARPSPPSLRTAGGRRGGGAAAACSGAAAGLAALALATANIGPRRSAGPKAAKRSRGGAVAARARVIVTDIKNEVPLQVRGGCVPSMDKFMEEHAVSVSLQNLQRMEEKPGEPGVKFCYLEPTDIGPFRTQMRMTVRVDLPESGRCDVKILNMENGSVNKETGEVTFPDPRDAPPFKFDTQNLITWTEVGNAGLKVLNTCEAKSETTLPFWFPLPDNIVQSVTTAFVRRVIVSGQEKVMEQMEVKYDRWRQQQI